MFELLIATATFLIGLALGWALSRSSGAAIAMREDNARLRAELAHQRQVVPEQLAIARTSSRRTQSLVRRPRRASPPDDDRRVSQACRSTLRPRSEGRDQRHRSPPPVDRRPAHPHSRHAGQGRSEAGRKRPRSPPDPDRADHAAQGRQPATGSTARGDRESGPRAAHAERPRPVGRSAAPPRHRAGRHDRSLRLRRAAVPARRVRPPAARRHRQVAG